MTGLGLNPGDPCYDPTRPSWLPYWFNDIQESECESGTTNWWAAGWSDLGQQGGAAVTEAVRDVASGAAAGAAAEASDISLSGGLLIGGVVVAAVLVLNLFLGKR
jgi:hypothetical protein